MIGVHCATAFALLATSSIHVAAAETGNYYYEHWCGMDGGLRLLDDTECAKRFPSPSRSFRDWTCSHRVIDEGDDDDAHLWKPQQDLKDVFVEPLTPMEDIGMAVVSIRRDVVTNEPLFRYFGTPNFGEPHETWSSSKIFAVANAGGSLRDTCELGGGNEQGGLQMAVNGKQSNETELGDLVTVICSYDKTQNYTSNGLSRYFHDIGGRERLRRTVEDVLEGVENGVGQSLGGNYGEASPPDLEFNFKGEGECAVQPDLSGVVIENYVSDIVTAELTKRLVLHSSLPPQYRFPGLEDTDVKTVLYGAETSNLFPGLTWGGMTSDTALYLQHALGEDFQRLTAEAGPDWRVFSKLGAGYSTLRDRGEITYTTYACFPTKQGRALELLVAAHASVPFDASLTNAEERMQEAVAIAVEKLLSHMPNK